MRGIWRDRRQARYLIVGAWNTLFGFALFTLLWLTIGKTVGYAATLVVAQVLVVIQSHAAQRWLVWRSHAAYFRELLRFAALYGVITALNLLLLTAAVELLDAPALLAQWSIGGALILGAYILQRRWTFRVT